MQFRPATLVYLILATSLRAEPDSRPNLFEQLSLKSKTTANLDAWNVTGQSASLPWLAETAESPPATWGTFTSFQAILDRVTVDEQPRMTTVAVGLMADPDRWRYREVRSRDLYWRKSTLELPAPSEVWTPYGGRNWTAQEKVRIPVPLSLPVAEQLFVYGQIDGSGDTLNSHQTSLYGKTGVGLKWSLIAKSELQLRYATLFSYADSPSLGRFQERAQPAVEVMARMPLLGPLEIEYTGAAVPAVTRSDTDQLRQELRFALPLRGDNELELGARYRWDYLQESSPWSERATLFLGVRFRH